MEPGSPLRIWTGSLRRRRILSFLIDAPSAPGLSSRGLCGCNNSTQLPDQSRSANMSKNAFVAFISKNDPHLVHGAAGTKSRQLKRALDDGRLFRQSNGQSHCGQEVGDDNKVLNRQPRGTSLLKLCVPATSFEWHARHSLSLSVISHLVT